MHEVLEQVRRHRVNVDGNVCTVMVTTLVLEVTLSCNSVSYEMLNYNMILDRKCDCK